MSRAQRHTETHREEEKDSLSTVTVQFILSVRDQLVTACVMAALLSHSPVYKQSIRDALHCVCS